MFNKSVINRSVIDNDKSEVDGDKGMVDKSTSVYENGRNFHRFMNKIRKSSAKKSASKSPKRS